MIGYVCKRKVSKDSPRDKEKKPIYALRFKTKLTKQPAGHALRKLYCPWVRRSIVFVLHRHNLCRWHVHQKPAID